MNAAVHALPENTRNQSSIDRLLNLPVTLAERERAFDAGLKEAKRQGLIASGVTITPRLKEIKLGYIDAVGRYRYRDSHTDLRHAVAALKANPSWFTADGVYNGDGKITIYATATSSNTRLFMAGDSMLQERINARLSFNRRLTSIENVLQTIAHELAHHAGLGHGDVSLYNKEYLAIKTYRSKK